LFRRIRKRSSETDIIDKDACSESGMTIRRRRSIYALVRCSVNVETKTEPKKAVKVRITDFLSANAIISDLAGRDKQAVLNELAEKFLATDAALNAGRVLEVLAEREKISSTAIGDGVAIPHGKLRNVDRVHAVFARSTAGVDFASLDGEPTYIFFTLIAPEDGAADHLKALARISRLLKDASFRGRLMDAQSGGELFDIIVSEDQKL
jgi:PTS system nitrogen regulatory IIA component